MHASPLGIFAPQIPPLHTWPGTQSVAVDVHVVRHVEPLQVNAPHETVLAGGHVPAPSQVVALVSTLVAPLQLAGRHWVAVEG